jgi:hypothetical protein
MSECKHFFVFGEKRQIPSCLGTHKAQCRHCFQNLFERLPDVIIDGVKLEEPEGKHVPLPSGKFEYQLCWPREWSSPLLGTCCYPRGRNQSSSTLEVPEMGVFGECFWPGGASRKWGNDFTPESVWANSFPWKITKRNAGKLLGRLPVFFSEHESLLF